MQVCNENVEKDEYHLLFACSEYKVSSKKYYGLLDGHDNLSEILKYPPKRVSKNVHALISHRVLLPSSIPLSI